MIERQIGDQSLVGSMLIDAELDWDDHGSIPHNYNRNRTDPPIRLN
jgi:hypothetical protein